MYINCIGPKRVPCAGVRPTLFLVISSLILILINFQKTLEILEKSMVKDYTMMQCENHKRKNWILTSNVRVELCYDINTRTMKCSISRVLFQKGAEFQSTYLRTDIATFYSFTRALEHFSL